LKYKKASISSLEQLLMLIKVNTCPYRDMKDKRLLKELEALNIITISGVPKVVVLNCEKSLFSYLQRSNQFIFNSVNKLEEYIEQEKNSFVKSKDEVAAFQLTTKDSTSESFYGINVAVLENTEVLQRGKPITLSPLYSGAYFFFQKGIIEIPKDTLVIGVENPQTLWFINRYKKVFKQEKRKKVFVLMNDYKNGYPYTWLKTINGPYLHFADFDISGVSIYLNKVVPKLKNKDLAEFYIPKNIKKLISKYGNRKDYNKQENLFDGVLKIAGNKEADMLRYIKAVGKSLEQEKLVFIFD